MLTYLRRSAAQVVFVLLGIALINFFLLHLAPGDAAQVLAGESGAATPEYMEALRRQFGLDQPLYVQFLRYLGNLVTFDLGYSFRQSLPVSELILQRLPATLLLMGTAIGFALVAGCSLGFLAARRAGKLTDTVISIVALLFYATPVFWVGIMLIVVFSVMLDWLPVGGMTSVEANLSGLALVGDVALHLVLPAVTLGLFYLAIYARLMRAAMLEVYGQDFVRTARAKGVRPRRIAWRHVLRNALLPIVTTLGVQLGSILGGAVLVETVFSWPGLGRLAFAALFQRDLNLLLGILFCSSVVVVLVNIAVDLVYTLLDPRIELN
ncbi:MULTISPECIES: ABC transporter permease [Azospirillum]|uniref:ABC transporter permease n=2 Tax=Azospirillum TaxID=191 RepID=A0A235H4Y2_AZOBR|nr:MULTISPECIES: ABC transporter permease [Azospirillum]KAA1052867.1 ABC transporter, permease protein 1 (cluster 5, nickel/peptides/opines) [Azospirillum argentinense]MBK3800728.1 ABC transporter permease subunit [Azospirillum argentinense]OYD80275.1 ABC transporter permease [Azospirillum brasilense]QCO04198.1 ABC transporter permease [Azospirillum argentinense]QCO17038.1 ABC transporter permease [Azospirillum brasilense]